MRGSARVGIERKKTPFLSFLLLAELHSPYVRRGHPRVCDRKARRAPWRRGRRRSEACGSHRRNERSCGSDGARATEEALEQKQRRIRRVRRRCWCLLRLERVQGGLERAGGGCQKGAGDRNSESREGKGIGKKERGRNGRGRKASRRFFFFFHPSFSSSLSLSLKRAIELAPEGLFFLFPPRVRFSLALPRPMPGTESPAPALAAAAVGPSTTAAAAAAAPNNNNGDNTNVRSASDEAMDAVAEARAVWPGAQTLVSVQELLDQNK